MTSRHACKLNFAKNEKGEISRTIGLRLALRGSMGLRAFDAETFSGTARRSSRGFCMHGSAQGAMGRLTRQELAEATGEKESVARLTLPPGWATARRSLPGFEHYDESRH
eukprot:3441280-Pyramimonas_sp.AAC.1